MLSGIVEFLGWFGAVTVLAGYILFSTGKLPNGPVYQLFNLVGGVSVAINVAAHHAVPSTIVNGIWAVVAVVVLVRMAKARRTARRTGHQPTPELHTEPLVTTAVLPVIGPAVHHHTAEAEPAAGVGPAASTDVTESADVATILQAADARGAVRSAPQRSDADPARTEPARTEPARTEPARTEPARTEPAAPMTASVPVITATIALALVSAAQEQHRAQRAATQADAATAPADRAH